MKARRLSKYTEHLIIHVPQQDNWCGGTIMHKVCIYWQFIESMFPTQFHLLYFTKKF